MKRGGVSRESIRLAVQLLRDGNMLGVFPEGSRSNAGGMGKKGAASLALEIWSSCSSCSYYRQLFLFRRMTIVYGEPLDLSAYAGASFGRFGAGNGSHYERNSPITYSL